ncbi:MULTISPECIES: hypothetical protein [Streptomyces]|uniref:hypothetical protein n=1 Tax=Streptomyces sp. SYP-A7185 TaxID=3040076 RepID=UPI0038F6B8AC
MPLQDYAHHGRTWALDPRTGLLTPAPPASGRCHGFVRTGVEAAALYADPSDPEPVLWLQYGRRRWDCATVTVRQWSGSDDGTRHFTVDDARGPALDLTYPAPDAGPFDPTYDGIDADADDFFLWAAGRLRDGDASPRTTLLAHFRAGFSPA